MAKRNYTLKPTYTPPAEAASGSKGAAKPAGARTQAAQERRKTQHAGSIDPNIRAEAEDDDGYDPYSDRLEPQPLFERDPWE